MENIKLVTITQNHEWEVYLWEVYVWKDYVWKDGIWPELVGLFETEEEADSHAYSFGVTVLKGISTAEAYAESKRLAEV